MFEFIYWMLGYDMDEIKETVESVEPVVEIEEKPIVQAENLNDFVKELERKLKQRRVYIR